ncbi:MAG: alanine--tRNA ligase [Gammaproteobacteria bacterium]|nr:alanine--tRNA ligase [Gammaproteobacteria bacterium]
MNSQQIREAFIRFFEQKSHTAVPSSLLVPGDDPTLLFTNAGMVQFKDVFLGAEQRPYQRATSVQKCVRAGGKHNDLENVGFTARHHTFFEMLGNFSFGDYFKREAISFAWELLTEIFHIPKEKLWVTVFEEDDEAYAIWKNEIGVNPERISKIGAKDNFWMMGDTGPCGPCTEIFYDHGEGIWGGPPGTPEGEGDRYIEIWNLVFMQFNRDASGAMTPLPKPSVDTGMGLERIAAVLQGVHDNYDIDIFKYLIEQAARILNVQDLSQRSLRVISDHIRSASFLIADGVIPSNEGRGYVLRRIIRRAIRHGHKLGMAETFFYKLVAPLKEMMGQAYPELHSKARLIVDTLTQEEEQFARTLAQGLKLYEEAVLALSGKVIPGEVIFKLYDTYGFPVDLTEDMARERDLTLDVSGFEVCMQQQKERGRQHNKFRLDYPALSKIEGVSEFVGYHTLTESSEVTGLYCENSALSALKKGQEGIVILAQTPFYPEGGGQIGDRGVLHVAGGAFVVKTTQKQNDAILHYGVVESGEIRLGMLVEAEVQDLSRRYTARNHSATHLLDSALRQILGAHVEQKGSLVAAESFRFDFSHPKPLTSEERQKIEDLVNEYISADYPVEILHMRIEAAKKMGAIALFGEKYGENVRVLKMGDVSTELCGGTHVKNTGEIGLFKITSEGSVASGVRRIEGVTSLVAKAYLESECAKAKARSLELEESLRVLQKQQEALETERVMQDLPKRLLEKKVIVQDKALIIADVGELASKYLSLLAADVKNKISAGIVVLVSRQEGKLSFIVAVTDALSKTLKAGDIVKLLAEQIGGKGGGKPELAQGGGAMVSDLPALLARLQHDLTQVL